MQRSVTIKNYVRAALILGFFAVLAVYLPHKPEHKSDLYFGMPVNQASVQHNFFNDPAFSLQQLNGVKIVNPDTGKITYYFEYIANKKDTLRRIGAMPFLKDNRLSSTTCELMNGESNPLDNSALTQEERDASSFFWNAKADEFTFYECYKSPVKHTLLLSNTSDRILHRIEFV